MSIVTCPSCGAKNRVDESRAQARQPVCGRCKRPLPSGGGSGDGFDHPVEVTDETFETVLSQAGDRPVLVDCWAEWCGPCRMLAPTIDQLASESAGRWIVAKLDTDRNPQTASRFRISSIPTLLIFKRGKRVDQLVGLQPKQEIEARLSRVA